MEGGNHMYKKAFSLLFIVAIAFMLVACGSDEDKRVFELDQDGIEITLTYYHVDDEVTKQRTKNVIDYEATGISSKEQAKELFDPEIAKMKGIKGVSHKMTYSNSEAIEELEIDYEKIDMDEAKELPGMELSGDLENGISMEASADMLLNQGFAEK